MMLPLTKYRSRVILIDAALHWRLQNETIWHEIAHLVRKDRAAGEFCAAGSWGMTKAERKTDDLACVLALPETLLARHGVCLDATQPGGWHIPNRDDLFWEIAEDADVTERMVWHRLGLYDMRTGLPKHREAV